MSVVVIDCDGVIVDFNSAFLGLLVSQGAEMRPFEQADPDRWDWPFHYGASRKQIDAAWAKATPQWWQQLDRHRDFIRPTREMLVDVCDDHDVYFVTSRPAGTHRATVEWLTVKAASVINPQVIVTPTRKAMTLVGLEPDVIIEDRPQTLLEYASFEKDLKLPPCRKILVQRNYNKPWWTNTELEVAPTTMHALTAVRHNLPLAEVK